MGIKGLCKFLKGVALESVEDWKNARDYKHKTVAIDASPCLYQCMTAMGDTPPGVDPGSEGDVSHIIGVLRRTVRLIELGMKPIFVFDGEAPDLKKSGALKHREEMRAKSREQLEEARRTGDAEGIRRNAVRLVKTTQRHNDEVNELLHLMGLPAVQAPGEAESLCAALASSGRADMAATEDMDAVVCGAPILLRNLHKASANPQVHLVQEIALDKVLQGLSLSRAEFVDFCILAGCDYVGTIARVGISTAYQLITKHRSIDKILETLDRSKFTVPEDWNYQAARDCFFSPKVGDIAALNLEERRPDPGALRALCVNRYALNASVVEEFIQRLLAARGISPIEMHVPSEMGVSVSHPARQDNHRFKHDAPRVLPTPARSRGGAKPTAKLTPPKGQHTLKGFLARKATQMATLESPRKKRRRSAIEAIEEQLGVGSIDASTEATLQDLELLAAELKNTCSKGVESLNIGDTAKSSSDGDVCLVLD